MRCAPRYIRNVERPIRLGAAGFIEAGQRAGDTEDFLGELCRHHIDVVGFGDSGESVGELDTRFLQHADVYRSTEVCCPVECRAKGIECARTIVNDRYVVAFFGQVQCQIAADAPTTGDDDSRVDPP